MELLCQTDGGCCFTNGSRTSDQYYGILLGQNKILYLSTFEIAYSLLLYLTVRPCISPQGKELMEISQGIFID